MVETIDRGPFVNAGSLLDNRIEPFDGPSIDNQGNVIPDPRFGPIKTLGVTPGRVPTWWNSPYVVMTDAIPMAASSSALAAAQVATSGTALTLATTALGGTADNVPSIAAGVPIVPLGTSVATVVTALDFGFTTGTTTASSSTVVVPDSTFFQVGQWLCIGGAGNTANTTSFMTQVAKIPNATTINVLPVTPGALTRAPIANTNLVGSGLLPPANPYSPAVTPTGVSPYIVGGLAQIFEPLETLARNVVVQASSSTGGTATILVSGFDIYGAPMSELLTASGTTAVYGKKAFKYVLSAVPQTSGAASYTLGVGDTFGFHIRSDKWEYTNLFYNGAFGTNNNGWTAATTAVATNTTGDVRGTIQVSLRGALATSFNGTNGTTNGTSRLTIMMSVPLYNLINATPINTGNGTAAFLTGVTQA